MVASFYDPPEPVEPIATLSVRGDGRRAEWVLRGSPMVVQMAARVFIARPSKDRRQVAFPLSPACFDDVVMLRHRFPIGMTREAERAWRGELKGALTRPKPGLAGPVSAPGGSIRFKGELKPFQTEGLAFMAAGRRTLLADEMGLGKTPQGLALIANQALGGPAVIVCQPHVLTHWRRKIEEFLDIDPTPGGEAVAVLAGRRPKALPPAAVYLIHYLNLAAWVDLLVPMNPAVVVFDEAQELRHTGTDKYRASASLADAAEVVAGLSGTPIYNAGPEIFNVMDALSPGCLAARKAFETEWCRGHFGKLVIEDPEALGRSLEDRGLMLRRRKVEVLGELPAKRRVIETIDGNNKLFAELARESVALAKQAETVADPFNRARMEMEAIEGTRRATGVAKAAGVAAFLRGLMEADEPTLVFAHHHDVQDALMQQLEPFFPVRISGRETMAEKALAQDRFVEGLTNLCFIGLRAATGLDGLQKRARVVVFAELDWSPAVHRQAEDRAHRMGQADSVLCYYLVADIGTDPFMSAALELKQSQFEGLMGDAPETEADKALSIAAADDHKKRVLAMLRLSR